MKQEILSMIEKIFDEEISSSCAETSLGLTSYIDGRDSFKKRLEQELDEIIPNKEELQS